MKWFKKFNWFLYPRNFESSLIFENLQEAFLIYLALKFIFIFLAGLEFIEIQFRDSWVDLLVIHIVLSADQMEK